MLYNINKYIGCLYCSVNGTLVKTYFQFVEVSKETEILLPVIKQHTSGIKNNTQ